MSTPSFSRIPRFLLLSAVLFSITCAKNPVTGKRQLSLMSTKQEVALGLQSDPQVQAEFGVYPDSVLQKYLDEKGQQMARISHRPGLKWHFKLVDSPVINAFALPGGYVYFTRGIMAHFNSEAQFAGVLGHEIGHVTARHGAEQYTKGMLAQIGLIAGMIASPKFAQFGEVASQGVQLLMLKNSRDNESQSDRLGVQYSSRIGYDARHMGDFFETLKRVSDKASGGHNIPTFLSTHPDPADRYAKVHEMAKEYQSKIKKPTYVENRNEYLNRIEGLVYGDDPRQGYVEGGRFYHPELKFQFPVPQGWKTQNMPTQFQMAPADQNAVMVLTLSGQKTPQAAAQEFLQKFQLTVREQQSTTINGLSSYVVLADQIQQQQTQQQGGQRPAPNQQPQGLRVLSYFIQYEGLVYVIFGAAEIKDFERYANSFLPTMKGFEKLSDPAKLSVKPERVRVKRVAQEQSLADALKNFGMPQNRLEELAILNGMKQNDRVAAGTLIKVVEK